MRRDWTRDEVLAALHLYTQLSFGQLHKGNANIQALAARMQRTPSSVAMKLTNLASLDPQITANGRKGLRGASALDRAVWDELKGNWDATALAAQDSYARLLGDQPSTEQHDEPDTWVQTRTVSLLNREASAKRLALPVRYVGLGEAIDDLGEHAARHGTPFLYEPLNRYETNLLNTPAQAAEFVEEVSSGTPPPSSPSLPPLSSLLPLLLSSCCHHHRHRRHCRRATIPRRQKYRRITDPHPKSRGPRKASAFLLH